MAVKNVLENAGLRIINIELGEAEINDRPSALQLSQIKAELNHLGFEIIDDQKSRLIEQIKNVVVNLVHYSPGPVNTKLSAILTDKLHYDYGYLSNLFSSVEGSTIEKYHIAQKIERAKELLIYNELNLSEIAWQLGYSSVAHLSTQFKQITGLTPTQFKKLQGNHRLNIEDL